MSKKLVLACTLCLLLSYRYVPYVLAEEDVSSVLIREDSEIDQLEQESYQQAIDYLEEHYSDSFETLHMEWKDGVSQYVLLFTDNISEEEQDIIRELVNDGSDVRFETVPFSKDELLAKQSEIEAGGFDYDGFTINYLGTDLLNGVVNVAIVPYNNENAQVIYDKFGENTVHVEEGDAVTTMDFGLEVEMTSDDETEEETEDLNFFQRIIRAIRNWFPW